MPAIKTRATFITVGTAATLSMLFAPDALAEPNNTGGSTASGTSYFSTGGDAGINTNSAASAEISKKLGGKAKIIDGRFEISPGLIR